MIVFFENGDDDISEAEWLKAASVNEAFEFLKDDAEAIYTRADGEHRIDENLEYQIVL